jgi:predicted phosphodiesterase
MRILIVSDIHANLAALEEVLQDAERRGPIDGVWSLGDCVGYGPQPGVCVARLREMAAVMVAGNHERACSGAMSTAEFNADAAAAAEWTKEQLSADEKEFLDSLPEVTRQNCRDGASDAEFTLVHGTLRWPVWEYLYTPETALAHLALQETPFGLVGHTHVPMIVTEDEALPEGCELRRLLDGEVVQLAGPDRLVINPGSVGQPRDGDPRASYALYDSTEWTVTLHRVEYAFNETQKLMSEAGLPRWLIERLAQGL